MCILSGTKVQLGERIRRYGFGASRKSACSSASQDLDFADLRKFQPGIHSGIILVRLQHPGRVELLNLLSWVFGTHDVESWNRCLVIVSETKIRIRRS